MRKLKKLLFLIVLLIIPTLFVSAKEISISSKAHVQSYGWLNAVGDGETIGTTGVSKRLEAFIINLNNSSLKGDIYYRSYIEANGWQDYVSSGSTSGTVGKSKRIEAIQIKLTDELSEEYDIYYRVHVANIGWLDWASNDEITGTLGYNYKIEGIQIKLIKKGNSVPSNTTDIYREKDVTITYSSQVQTYGWLSYVSSGETSGTTGLSKRLESFIITKSATSLSGDIYYRSYVQGSGWQDYVSSGSISGTVGKSKQLEAIQIKLTDELSEEYDIYYRVHVANIGWLDWASNDEITGTLGYNYKIEAIQIKLIKKGNSVPSNTTDIYREKDVKITYSSQVQTYGWLDYVSLGEVSGTEGKNKRLEAFKISKSGSYPLGDIYYRSYVEGSGWQDYVSSGSISGTVGQSKKIEMIQIKLTGDLSEKYDIYYSVYIDEFGWLDWASNDEVTGSLGYNYSIEAIKIKLIEKDSDVSLETSNIYKEKSDYLTYSVHMQTYGWLNSVYSKETAGSVGSGKRIEALKININNTSISGTIKYSVHVQSYGWMDYVENGELAGTTGLSKRVEAIKIELTDELAEKYDVYYRTYVEDFGWLDWAKNGEIAGSISLSKRMEGLQITLVEKGGDAPGSTEQSYTDSIFRIIDGKTYYYSNGSPVTGFKTISGTKYFFNSTGVLIGTNVKKIIDVSQYQGDIDWEKVKNDDVDGAIIRLGYGTSYTTDSCVEDRKFSSNYSGATSAGLLAGIYLYSYAIDAASAKLEGEFVLNKLKEYNVSKNIPIYYDLESNAWTSGLSSSKYDTIVSNFVSILENNGYTVKVYTYKYWAENKLSSSVKSRLTWIAQYADYCTYTGSYKGWQYTSTGSVDGISGNVDISVWFN